MNSDRRGYLRRSRESRPLAALQGQRDEGSVLFVSHGPRAAAEERSHRTTRRLLTRSYRVPPVFLVQQHLRMIVFDFVIRNRIREILAQPVLPIRRKS